MKYSLHFDINYKSILEFVNGFKEPVDYNYLSPGEYSKRNYSSIIRTYGRDQDKKISFEKSTGFSFKHLLSHSISQQILNLKMKTKKFSN